MAEGGTPLETTLNLGAKVSDQLLSNLAYNFYPDHLDRFVKSLLGWDDVTFSQLKHNADKDAWRTAYYVSKD